MRNLMKPFGLSYVGFQDNNHWDFCLPLIYFSKDK